MNIGAKADSPSLSRVSHDALAEQIRQLYRAAGPGIVANALLGGLLVYALWEPLPAALLFPWLGANFAVNLARFVAIRYALATDAIGPKTALAWARFHVLSTAAISALWGLATWALFVPNDLPYQLFLTLIVGGMTAAALPVVGLFFHSYLAYLLPILVPLFARFWMEGDLLHQKFALATLLFVLTMVMAARQYHNRVAQAIEAQLSLQRLAHLDGLTGVPNRRAFDARLQEEWFRAARSRQPLSLLILDIDHFKAYNDLYGHPAGDDCLKRVARTVNHVIQRGGDFSARVGGEEFAVLLPQTDQVGASFVARRISESVADMAMAHTGSPEGRVTVSLGAATTTPNLLHQPSALYEEADQGLYLAKCEGRNRTKWAPWDGELKLEALG